MSFNPKNYYLKRIGDCNFKIKSRNVHFTNPVTTFGRARDSDVFLRCQRCSSKHCKIIFEDGKIFIEDVGSSAGTIVNSYKFKNEKIQIFENTIIGMGADPERPDHVNNSSFYIYKVVRVDAPIELSDSDDENDEKIPISNSKIPAKNANIDESFVEISDDEDELPLPSNEETVDISHEDLEAVQTIVNLESFNNEFESSTKSVQKEKEYLSVEESLSRIFMGIETSTSTQTENPETSTINECRQRTSVLNEDMKTSTSDDLKRESSVSLSLTSRSRASSIASVSESINSDQNNDEILKVNTEDLLDELASAPERTEVFLRNNMYMVKGKRGRKRKNNTENENLTNKNKKSPQNVADDIKGEVIMEEIKVQSKNSESIKSENSNKSASKSSRSSSTSTSTSSRRKSETSSSKSDASKHKRDESKSKRTVSTSTTDSSSDASKSQRGDSKSQSDALQSLSNGSNLKSQNGASKFQIDALKSKSGALKHRRSTSTSTTDSLTSKNSTIKSQSDSSKSQSDSSKPQRDASKSQSDASKSQSDALKSQSDASKYQSNALKSQSDALKSQSDAFKSQRDDSKSRNSTSESRNSDSESQVSSTQKRKSRNSPQIQEPNNINPQNSTGSSSKRQRTKSVYQDEGPEKKFCREESSSSTSSKYFSPKSSFSSESNKKCKFPGLDSSSSPSSDDENIATSSKNIIRSKSKTSTKVNPMTKKVNEMVKNTLLTRRNSTYIPQTNSMSPQHGSEFSEKFPNLYANFSTSTSSAAPAVRPLKERRKSVFEQQRELISDHLNLKEAETNIRRWNKQQTQLIDDTPAIDPQKRGRGRPKMTI